MQQTEQIEKFKQILVENFEAKAKAFDKQIQDIHYCFLLKDSHHYRCVWGKIEVKLVEEAHSISFLLKPLVALKVNGFVKDALLRFSHQYQIKKEYVNMLMNIDQERKLTLTLRNGSASVKQISIEELI